MVRKFKLGQAAATMPIIELCRQGLDLGPYFERHASGDWGEAESYRRQANEKALVSGDPICSVYTGHGRRFWIITSGDRTRTVVQLPSDIDDID